MTIHLSVVIAALALATGAISVVHATPIPEHFPTDLAVNPDTNRLFVIARHVEGPATLFAIDGATNIVAGSRDLESDIPRAHRLDLIPASNRLYILGGANSRKTVLGVLDGETLQLVGRKEFPGWADSIRIDTTRNLIYATNYFDDIITILNAITLEVEGVIPVGKGPPGVDLHEGANRIYVANSQKESVSVIDGETRAVIATLKVGVGPERVAVNPTTNHIYVTNHSGHSISVIDGSVPRVVAKIRLHRWPNGMALNSATNRIYVAGNRLNPRHEEGLSDVTAIDGTTNTVIERVPVGYRPIPVAVNAVLNRLYVGNWNLHRFGYPLLDPNISAIYGLDLLDNPSFDADAGREPPEWRAKAVERPGCPLQWEPHGRWISALTRSNHACPV